jgi:Na+/proline symporter
VGRARRLLLPYAVVVAEYLAAAGVFYASLKATTPTPPPYRCVDSCWGGGLWHGLVTVSGSAVLSLGLLFALIVVTVRYRGARAGPSEPESGREAARAASVAAATGAMWGVIAFVGLCCLGWAAFKLLQRL